MVFLLLSACTHLPSAQERLDLATRLAQDAGWTSEKIETSLFELQAFISAQPAAKGGLTIFIEGDGFAWVSSSQASSDPTPINPVALKLALAHQQNAAVAYLARPCQFVNNDKERCTKKDWTSHRFSEEVVSATDEAISRLKTLTKATELRLVGYSGGGAVATLVAARRDDVVELVTLAGNLNTALWAELHNVSPLTGSLNPVDFVASLPGIKQTHFVGENDTIVSRQIADSFRLLSPQNAEVRVISIPNADHHCCWLSVTK